MRKLIFAIGLSAVTGAWACNPQFDGAAGAGAKTIESKHYKILFRTQPEKVVMGKHFAVELAYCAKDSAPAASGLRVDAHMPEHRHGMNYKTVVTSTGPQRYRAEGLMFHMPGRWEYIFEVRAGEGANVVTERLTSSMILQ